MTQEEKLLLVDLCGRLPYGVIIQVHTDYDWAPIRLYDIDEYGVLNNNLDIEKCKPYLRPMSSMTEEEKNELQTAFNIKYSIIGTYGISSNDSWWVKDRKEPLGFDAISYKSFSNVIEFLNKKMFDYRGLIDKGLALEAPKDMYNIK